MSSPRDRDENLVDEERVAESGVLAPKSPRKMWAELVAPQPRRLVANLDAAFGEQVLDVAVAETETMVESDRVLNDGGRESVSFVGIGRWAHVGIVAQAHLT